MTATVASTRPFERKMPPVVEVAMVALAAAVTGGVILAAQATEEPSLTIPTILMVAAAVLELVAAVLLVRIRPFAWDRFRLVYGWAFVAYAIQAGMIEWSFAKNDTPAGPLTLLTIGLVVFATVVPLMIGFTVARYQAVDEPAGAVAEP
jgi:hypothetical protein